MTNTKLTDRKIAVILARAEICDDSVLTDYADIVAAMRELQERRKAEAPGYPETLPCPVFVPQALNIEDEYKNYEYVAGWNDCRNAVLVRNERTKCDE